MVVPDAAYYVKVRTYASDTPDPAATLRALISQKPGGLVLDYAAITGQTYGDVKARYATYADVTGFYTDYLAVKQDDKHFLLRPQTTGCAGAVFQAAGVASPPMLDS